MEKKYIIVFFSIVFIIMILINLIVGYIKSGEELNKYNNMKKDILILDDAIAIYYLNNSSLPIKGNRVEFYEKYNINDGADYYEIDLNKLENLKLSFGNKEYGDDDKYIINKDSHTIYYYKGIQHNNKKTFTREDIDYSFINLDEYK